MAGNHQNTAQAVVVLGTIPANFVIGHSYHSVSYNINMCNLHNT